MKLKDFVENESKPKGTNPPGFDIKWYAQRNGPCSTHFKLQTCSVFAQESLGFSLKISYSKRLGCRQFIDTNLDT